MDENELVWALKNISEDSKDEAEKVTAVINILKPWINNELYWKEQDHIKAKEQDDYEKVEMIKNMKDLGIPENAQIEIEEKKFDDDFSDVFE